MVLNPALTVYHRVLEKIGNFTATESLGPDPGADMPFFCLFICCASSQQLQTADVLTLKTEIKPNGTFLHLPPLHPVVFVHARDSEAQIVARSALLVWLLRQRFAELYSPPSVRINRCHGYRPEVLCRGDKWLYEFMNTKLFSASLAVHVRRKLTWRFDFHSNKIDFNWWVSVGII